jgi:hypothetical protein
VLSLARRKRATYMLPIQMSLDHFRQLPVVSPAAVTATHRLAPADADLRIQQRKSPQTSIFKVKDAPMNQDTSMSSAPAFMAECLRKCKVRYLDEKNSALRRRRGNNNSRESSAVRRNPRRLAVRLLHRGVVCGSVDPSICGRELRSM